MNPDVLKITWQRNTPKRAKLLLVYSDDYADIAYVQCLGPLCTILRPSVVSCLFVTLCIVAKRHVRAKVTIDSLYIYIYKVYSQTAEI